jgi:hypothetical protein
MTKTRKYQKSNRKTRKTNKTRNKRIKKIKAKKTLKRKVKKQMLGGGGEIDKKKVDNHLKFFKDLVGKHDYIGKGYNYMEEEIKPELEREKEGVKNVVNEGVKKRVNRLHIACYNGNIQQVKDLLEESIVDVNEATPKYQMTPLYIASFWNHVEIVEELLKQPNIDVMRKTAYGETPIYVAITKNHTEVAKAIDRYNKGNDESNNENNS